MCVLKIDVDANYIANVLDCSYESAEYIEQLIDDCYPDGFEGYLPDWRFNMYEYNNVDFISDFEYIVIDNVEYNALEDLEERANYILEALDYSNGYCNLQRINSNLILQY